MDMPNHALHTSQRLSSSWHFWWIAFLRCSPDYWWICQQNGRCQDERLVKVWQDFGNLYQYSSFAQWWHATGSGLFDSPQIEIPLNPTFLAGLRVLCKQELVEHKPGTLYVAIPMSADAGALSLAILQVFENARVRGEHYFQDAPYQLAKAGAKGLPSVVFAYLTMALKVCVAQSQEGDPIHHWGGYQMGKHLALSPQNLPKPSDTLKTSKKKQDSTRVKQCQMAKAARDLIANVEVGKFPCRSEVKPCPRWTPKQSADMAEAIAAGAWQPADWFVNEHSFMLPEHHIGPHPLTKPAHGAPPQPMHLNLACLADLQNIDQPFRVPVKKRR